MSLPRWALLPSWALLPASGLFLLAAAYAYGKKSRWIPLLLLFPYFAVGVDLAGRLIGPVSPTLFWIVAIVGAGLPLLVLAVALADMKWGLFCLDTFFGFAFVAILSPVLLLVNALAILIRSFIG